jgi:hypothetical protein
MPDWVATADEWSNVRASVMEPWQFKIEMMQQSGSEVELGLALAGQQA